MNAYERFMEFFNSYLGGAYDNEIKCVEDLARKFSELAGKVFTDKEKILSDEEWLLVPKAIRKDVLGCYMMKFHDYLMVECTKAAMARAINAKNRN